MRAFYSFSTDTNTTQKTTQAGVALSKTPVFSMPNAKRVGLLSTAPDANRGWTARKRIPADLHNAVEGEPQASGQFPNALPNDCDRR
jgi:hypothetical protein